MKTLNPQKQSRVLLANLLEIEPADLRAWRLRRRIPLRQLARMVLVAPATLNRWESGESEPGTTRIVALQTAVADLERRA